MHRRSGWTRRKKNIARARAAIKQCYADAAAHAESQRTAGRLNVNWPREGVRHAGGSNELLQHSAEPTDPQSPESCLHRFHFINGGRETEEFCCIRRWGGDKKFRLQPAPRFEFMFSAEGGEVECDDLVDAVRDVRWAYAALAENDAEE